VGYARDVLGVHLWSKQREIAESVRDNRRTAVRSGHGVGKTTTAAVIILWFLDTRQDSRVVSTANEARQIRTVLWAEIIRLWRDAKERPAAQGRPIFTQLVHIGGEPLQTEMKLRDGRYAIGISSAPERAEGFQGHHAPNILFVIDEASGVDRRIYEAGSGFMTTAGARMLLLGNPTRPEGEFYAAFHSRRDAYKTFAISALDSPAVTGDEPDLPADVLARLPGPEGINDYRRMYGEGSVMWDVRVLGQFPSQSSDAVIALSDVEAAQERHIPADNTKELVVIGCDVARFGEDETVIVERVGQRIRIVEVYNGKPTTYTAARVMYWAEQHPVAHVRAVIDDAGVGGGVTDQLRGLRLPVTGFNGANAAQQPLKFPNRRSELWFQTAAQIEDLDLDPDDQLAADLTAPRYGYDLKLRRVVEQKADTKKRLGRSPDRADAVMLTLVPEPGGGMVVAPLSPQRSPVDGRKGLPDLRRSMRPKI
jgi:phage terminase large subunit